MKIHDWNPDDGDALQGDVILFRVPDHIATDRSDEITPRENRLILAEGEVTGHHHAIRLVPQPAAFRDDGLARDMEAMAPAATAKLYRAASTIREMVRAGELTTDRLAIGILEVDGGPVVLRHDEHDAIRIPPGRFYVGGQQEFDAGEARRVAD